VAKVCGGNLIITGDKYDNQFTVTPDDTDPNKVWVSNFDGTTNINGSLAAKSFTGVTKGITINLGKGNDLVGVGNLFGVAGTGVNANGQMVIAKDLVIGGLTGNDTIGLSNLAIGGSAVIEAGSGSGSLTLALSWFSGPTGRVYSYEQREEFHRLCRRNLDWAGLGENVELFCQDISQGFSQSGVDALFLDVREPWHYLDQAAAAVRPGGMLGFLMPTHHQVCDLLRGMETRPFEEPDVLEILLRRHKPVADRFRPADRMVAHTGYLIFTRKLCETGRPAAAPPAEESDLEI